MADRHEAARRVLEDAVFRGEGRVEARLRRAIARRRGVPEELSELVEKIAKHAYTITAEDIARLRDKYGEDELFEIIVSAAVGAAADRLHAGLRLLDAE